MTSVQHVAHLAMNLGKQFKAVIEIGEFLEKLGQLDAAFEGAERRTEKANARCTAAQQEQEHVFAELEITKTEFSRLKGESVEMRQETKLVCQKIVREAEEGAVNILQTAELAADDLVKDANATVRISRDVYDDVQKQIVAQRRTLDKLRHDMKTLKEGLG